MVASKVQIEVQVIRVIVKPYYELTVVPANK